MPGDVSLTGFDDVLTSSLMTPPLTTVRQAIYDMGELAAKAALRLLRGESVSMQVFTPELIIRDSTRPPAQGESHPEAASTARPQTTAAQTAPNSRRGERMTGPSG